LPAAHKLFEAIKVTRVNTGEVPRAFTDYPVTLDHSSIPASVEVLAV